MASGRLGVPSRSSSIRASSLRKASGRPERSGAASPAESTLASGTKRKNRDFDEGDAAGEGTNINVVVRCRGRNEREAREGCTMVVRTEGAKGKLVELSMGANALSNKTYSFDRVYSPVADQNMVFDDTVKPILEEMLAGYNCTIFAYGQTGTGKTYTMSGDMTETLGMLSDNAGIIPRVLRQLFSKLQADKTENCVKCSFIELYNEELRDLLAVEEGGRLKIYDDTSRKGHSATIVQGMEEKFIKSASEGIKVLQEGSVKRQVAATKCNDLSSRSHTIFTITAYVKKTNEEGGEDLVSAGKLNLVDLAGSENIQRSGAENKRATEAGLINKSLLTLGRVINALVDRSAHIPYRESKLTRLLQDSLGGRTKTCIIATISPAKNNLEETISTLDYAFRAKNICNMPQVNALLSKGMVMGDLASQIDRLNRENDRLKRELIATRQRNGVYLSNDVYEEMTAQSESRRIVLEEQTAKMETLETNLQNKMRELIDLTKSLKGLHDDHQATRSQLDEANAVVDELQAVVAQTQTALEAQTRLRKAHQHTEEKLAEVGRELMDKLRRANDDVAGLHAKSKRKSDVQSLNRAAWTCSQAQVADVTAMVERRLVQLRDEQLGHVESVASRMSHFVREEMGELSTTQSFLDHQLRLFVDANEQLLEHYGLSRAEMDQVLDGVKAIASTVKSKVDVSLQVMSEAANRISSDIAGELTGFHTSVQDSYTDLEKYLKHLLEGLVEAITNQRKEIDGLHGNIRGIISEVDARRDMETARIRQRNDESRRDNDEKYGKVMALAGQLMSMLQSQHEAQNASLADEGAQRQQAVAEQANSFNSMLSGLQGSARVLDGGERKMLLAVDEARDQLEKQVRRDATTASQQSARLQQTVQQVQDETERVVAEQGPGLAAPMRELEQLVGRARSEAAGRHETQSQSMQTMAQTVEQSFGSISAHFRTTFDRVKKLGDDMDGDAADAREALAPLQSQVCQPLAALRRAVVESALIEYQPTGETPQKTLYAYPAKLPRTRLSDGEGVLVPGHEVLPGHEDERPDVGSSGIDNSDDDDGDDMNNAEKQEDQSILLHHGADSSSSLSSASASDNAEQPPPPGIGKKPGLREVSPNVSCASADTAASLAVAVINATSINATPAKPAGRKTHLGGGVSRGLENLVPLAATPDVSIRRSARRKTPRIS